jgi:hypothetical protein
VKFIWLLSWKYLRGKSVNVGKAIKKLLQSPSVLKYSGCSTDGKNQLILFENVEEKRPSEKENIV